MRILPSSRKYRYLTRLGFFLIATTLVADMSGCYANPPPCGSLNLEIRTWYDLDAARYNLCGNHTLMNDLDSSTPGYEELAGPMANGGRGWEPIGFGYEELASPFKGTFHGQGYEIRDLFMHGSHSPELGLFGFSGGVIEDIALVNATVIAVPDVPDEFVSVSIMGTIVGTNYGTVANSYSTGNVSGDADWGGVGGLVGENRGTVSDSYYVGTVNGNAVVGGLVGENYGAVSNSHYNCDEVLINGEHIITRGALFGEDFDEWLANDKFLDVNDRLSRENGYYLVNNVTDFRQLLAFGQNATLRFRLKNDLDLAGEPNLYIPYLAGEFDGNGHKISNLSFEFDFVFLVGLFGCLAPDAKVSQVCVENVNITGGGHSGGLVGVNGGGTIDNSCSTGNVTGRSIVGGLVGDNAGGTVSNSYSTGNATGDRLIGGLVGCNRGGTVSNSYSTCSVKGNEDIGGLVGFLYGGGVSKSYSCGGVTGNENVGGLVGSNHGGSVSDSFWSIGASGQASSAGGIGLSTAQMKNMTAFWEAEWSIMAVANPSTRNPAYIWNIVNGVTYPFLSWQS